MSPGGNPWRDTTEIHLAPGGISSEGQASGAIFHGLEGRWPPISVRVNTVLQALSRWAVQPVLTKMRFSMDNATTASHAQQSNGCAQRRRGHEIGVYAACNNTKSSLFPGLRARVQDVQHYWTATVRSTCCGNARSGCCAGANARRVMGTRYSAPPQPLSTSRVLRRLQAEARLVRKPGCNRLNYRLDMPAESCESCARKASGRGG
jgi:hypothetical protein